ncbi:Replication protein A 70 kDa DNA-binding subunit, partial [Podochytrium sp. JEL0797]
MLVTALEVVETGSGDPLEVPETSSLRNRKQIPGSPNQPQRCIMPLNRLDPTYSNKQWMICVRVLRKSSVNEFPRKCVVEQMKLLERAPDTPERREKWKRLERTPDTRMFTVMFGDESGEIQGLVFDNEIDRFFAFLEYNRCFFVSGANISVAEAKVGEKVAYTDAGKVIQKFKMILNGRTEIVACHDASLMPALKIDRVLLSEISSFEIGDIIDVVVGIPPSDPHRPPPTTPTPTKIPLFLTIADESGHSCRVGLWDTEADLVAAALARPDAGVKKVWVLKRVKVEMRGGAVGLMQTWET